MSDPTPLSGPAREREQVLQAATELEDIALLAKIMVDELRNARGHVMNRAGAYDRLYWLRHRVAQSVVKLGAGPGTGQKQLTEWYEHHLQQQD